MSTACFGVLESWHRSTANFVGALRRSLGFNSCSSVRKGRHGRKKKSCKSELHILFLLLEVFVLLDRCCSFCEQSLLL
jgi:hypothetical protein